MKADVLRVTRRFSADNAVAARIILADPLKYAGLPLIWARLFLECSQKERPYGRKTA
jgi:hypothetical protein